MPTRKQYDGESRWHCSECGHEHTGIQWNWICIGCPCDWVPDHPTVDAAMAAARAGGVG